MKRAIRALAARPGFAVTAVLTLAAGFAVNAAVFSVTRSVLLRPLPYRDADRILQVGEASPIRGVSYSPAVPANYAIWRARASTFDETAGWRVSFFSIAGGITPVRVQGVLVEPSFFPMLGVGPFLGRDFTPDEGRAGATNVVLLSNGFWRRQFGADPDIVGRVLTVDGDRCTVVGVLPDTFKFIHVIDRELEVWRPLVVNPNDREHSMTVYAKLKAGVTLERAQAELDTIYASLPPEAFRDRWTATAARLATRLRQGAWPIVTTMEVAVALVLCIAAANIANLVLAIAAGRRNELAVRVALGATRRQLFKDLGRETLVLSAASALLGLVTGAWIVALLNRTVSYQDIGRLEPFRVDVWVVCFVLALAAASTILFALVPVQRAADADVVDALKDSSQRVTRGAPQRRLRALLVVGELALSIVLLTLALGLARTAVSLNGMRRGVDADRVMTAQLSLNGPRYDNTAGLTSFADMLSKRLATGPGVASASLVNFAPLSLIGTGVAIAVDGPTDVAGQEPMAQYWIVAPRYFATLGIPILDGRDFHDEDQAGRPGVAIVSRHLAERFWGSGKAVGHQLTALFPDSDAFWIPRTIRRPLRIVGEVGDVRENGIPGFIDDDLPQLYLPYSQNPTHVMTVVVRTPGVPQAMTPLIREAVRAVDADQPLSHERTLDDVRRETFARSREIAWLIGAFALLALALSSAGVYAVVAYLTMARRHEIAIRVALGATRATIVRLIVGDAMQLAGGGVLAGVLAAPLAFAAARRWLFGVDRSDPWTLGGVCLLLTVVAAVAAAVPASRAARHAAVQFR